MTHVVTENCIKCKYTDCVDVCPVDCFREGPNFLVIDPDECIDCAVCIPECPANAIYPEDDVPADQVQFIELNAELAKRFLNGQRLPLGKEPSITVPKEQGRVRVYLDDKLLGTAHLAEYSILQPERLIAFAAQ